jgi:hypothetical protein
MRFVERLSTREIRRSGRGRKTVQRAVRSGAPRYRGASVSSKLDPFKEEVERLCTLTRAGRDARAGVDSELGCWAARQSSTIICREVRPRYLPPADDFGGAPSLGQARSSRSTCSDLGDRCRSGTASCAGVRGAHDAGLLAGRGGRTNDFRPALCQGQLKSHPPAPVEKSDLADPAGRRRVIRSTAC